MKKEENEVLQSRVKSLELNVEEMKTSKEELICLHNSEKSSLLQKNETQLSTLNDSIDTHLREKKANELVSILRCPLSICFSFVSSHTNTQIHILCIIHQEIEKLTSSNAELSTLNDEQGKDNKVLESKVSSLKQSVKALKTKEDDLIRSHKEEVAIQNEVSYYMAYSWQPYHSRMPVLTSLACATYFFISFRLPRG